LKNPISNICMGRIVYENYHWPLTTDLRLSRPHIGGFFLNLLNPPGGCRARLAGWLASTTETFFWVGWVRPGVAESGPGRFGWNFWPSASPGRAPANPKARNRLTALT
jgi:hypothetical protein